MHNSDNVWTSFLHFCLWEHLVLEASRYMPLMYRGILAYMQGLYLHCLDMRLDGSDHKWTVISRSHSTLS